MREQQHARMRPQAVARIHRMNQERATRVVRFVTGQTVEAALHRLNAAKAATGAAEPGAATARGAAEPPLMLADVASMLFDPQHGG